MLEWSKNFKKRSIKRHFEPCHNAQSLLNTWQKTFVKKNWPKQQVKSVKMFLFSSASGLFPSMRRVLPGAIFSSTLPMTPRAPQFTLVFSRPHNQLIATGYESGLVVYLCVRVCVCARVRVCARSCGACDWLWLQIHFFRSFVYVCM